jgi:L-fucose isomerase-like protein
VKIKIDDPRGFVHETSGNHHVMVYGDFREKLRELNRIFGIATVEM